jgi:hydroxyacid-oxoacid transhydrogenase
MAASSIRFGPGCTKEVGMDFKNMGAERICVVTDSNVAKLDAMKQVVEALTREGRAFTVFTTKAMEPKDSTYAAACIIQDSKATDTRTASRKQSTLQNPILQMPF